MVLADELTQINTNFNKPDRDGGDIFYNYFPHTLKVKTLPVKVETTNIGHAFILGHVTNGNLHTSSVEASGINGSAITLADEGWGAETVSRVYNVGNIFREYLRTTTFVDDANTTATVNTSTHKITF